MAQHKDASLETTKQMLDELDALMEKMLSLPVNEAEDGPAFPQEVVKTPALSAKLTLLAAPTTAPPVNRPPRSQPAPEPTVHAPFNPPHIEIPPAPVPLPMSAPPQPEPLTNDVLPPSLVAKLEPLLTDVSDPASTAHEHHSYDGVLWLNQTFDHATLPLGGAGRWLRGQTGRTLVGFLGIALLMIAVGWILRDVLGWNW